jgi:hypothetical protein
MDLFTPLNGSMLQLAENISDRDHAEGFAKAWFAGYSLAWTLYHHGGRENAPAPADMSFELRPRKAGEGEVQSFALKPTVALEGD